MLGLDISSCPGLGDKIQFTSLPENYYKTFGKKLIDVNKEWIFDYNPFVIRDKEPKSGIFNPWGISHPRTPFPVWRSLAERNAAYLNAEVYLRHPRFYRFEDNKKTEVVIHTTGISRGIMPDYIMDFICSKYPNAIQVGGKNDVKMNIKDLRGLDIWDTIEVISRASIFIGVDSSLSIMASCYPECFNKKLLVQFQNKLQLFNWTPMDPLNGHTHWHDNTATLFNVFDDDVGCTYSYRKL